MAAEDPREPTAEEIAAKKARKAEKKAKKAAKALEKAQKEPQVDGDATSKKKDKKRKAEAEEPREGEKDRKSKKNKKDKQKAVADEEDESCVVDGAPASTESEAKPSRESYFEANAITISGDDKLKPVLKFSDLDLPQALLEVVKDFAAPTPIQACTWPVLLKKRDVIGIARTGSGKTIAFGLPLFNHVKHQIKHLPKAPRVPALVLAPTRELAMQIHDTFAKHQSITGVKSVCIYGGVPKMEQKQALSKGVHVVVATPGRLMDLMEEGACGIDDVSYLVLDEADRMLDMGFERDVRTIIGKIKGPHQTAMFSATWPPAIRKLASEFLKDPVRVTIGAAELQANEKITQHVEVMEQQDKERKLFELLGKVHSKTRKNRVLVFALYKKEAARLEDVIARRGYGVCGIHGDLSQAQRTKALNDFKNGDVPILVATDVAARGLDIPQVEVVINVTFPLTIEDYVHRIGRTARGGASGVSYTFFTSAEKHLGAALSNVLRDANQTVPDSLRQFGGTVKKKVDPNYGAFVKDIDPSVKATKVTFDSDEE